MSSYRFEEYNYQNTLFKNIDMTYVLHLENNGRLDSVKNQLNLFKPSEKCKILYNKGYKKSYKPHLPEQTSGYDLIDAYLHIMKDAKINNFQNILILEDDFFFDKNVSQYTEDIDNFIIKNDYYIYTLGTIPFILYPCDITFKHYKYFIKGGAHAMIYNNKVINNILNMPQNEIGGWDPLTNHIGGYCYYTPLCYQLFTETENRANWGQDMKTSSISNIFSKELMVQIILSLISSLNLDKSETPGYFIAYYLSKGIFYLFIVTVIYFLLKMFKKY